MSYYIGADLGTSSLKLLLVGSDGQIRNTVSKSYPIDFPNAGWSEQRPEEWWDAFLIGVRELIAGIDPSDIKGIGAGGQMHGLVMLDEDGTVIRPAILWNDGRTAKETDYLNGEIGKERLSKLTGNIAFAGFTAPKILWIRENEPENFARINMIMLPKDYLVYRLTGQHVTDYSDAAGTLLLDVKNKRWSEEMLAICDIAPDVMPGLCDSSAVVGNVLPEVAEQLGLSPETSVVAGAADNAAAALGMGAVDSGSCNLSLGTSGTVFVPTEHFADVGTVGIHSFCHANGKYHLMGCILSAASCNKWFCEDILGTSDFSKEQASITDDMLGNNHVYYLPYLMGERSPINDTFARSTFTGMRLDTKRSDMLLAVLEGVAFAIKDNFEVAKSCGVSVEKCTLCGGGAKSPLWQKILADVLNIEIVVPFSEDGPAYGGAMLAMTGCGEYDTIADCAKELVKYKSSVLPDKEKVSLYSKQYEKYRLLYPALKEFFRQ